LSDGIRRSLLDDTVVMKSERNNMCVGIADSGYCASDCFVVCVVVALVRGSAEPDIECIEAIKAFFAYQASQRRSSKSSLEHQGFNLSGQD
jgi:hypothetical protein